MQFAGVDDLMKKYQARAAVEGVDALGYYTSSANRDCCYQCWGV
jgi:hypothetical protein